MMFLSIQSTVVSLDLGQFENQFFIIENYIKIKKMAKAYYEYQNQIQFQRNYIDVKLLPWLILGFNGARKNLVWSNQH